MYKRLYEEEHNLHLSHTHSSEALAGFITINLLAFPYNLSPPLVQSILNENMSFQSLLIVILFEMNMML